MLTRATRADRKLASKETSFIGIFRKLGFYTTWLGMQGTYTAIDSPYFDLAKESHKALLLGTDVDVFSGNDSSLFPLIDNFYQDQPNGKNLLILHTYGSHFHYEERYTDEFRKYQPTCKKKKFLTDMSHCSVEEIINSYDNSILYTDYFVKSVIDRLRDKKALVIYASDHGESLGEGGRFLHGTFNNGEQIAVSMSFWMSDKYMKAFPQMARNLRNFSKEHILHDHLFHSILGCSGIKSSIIENKLNLCGNKS
jgi:glucan phosphoethanolaminetransferase (alkaline phosphatase superfamily)